MEKKKFVPIENYHPTLREIAAMWDFNGDLELQSIIIKLQSEVQYHNTILCSISGGWDSDVMMDMMERFGGHGKTTYIFQNTGLEYEATKRHLEELKVRYGVEIIELKPKKPIPVCQTVWPSFLE